MFKSRHSRLFKAIARGLVFLFLVNTTFQPTSDAGSSAGYAGSSESLAPDGILPDEIGGANQDREALKAEAEEILARTDACSDEEIGVVHAAFIKDLIPPRRYIGFLTGQDTQFKNQRAQELAKAFHKRHKGDVMMASGPGAEGRTTAIEIIQQEMQAGVGTVCPSGKSLNPAMLTSEHVLALIMGGGEARRWREGGKNIPKSIAPIEVAGVRMPLIQFNINTLDRMGLEDPIVVVGTDDPSVQGDVVMATLELLRSVEDFGHPGTYIIQPSSAGTANAALQLAKLPGMSRCQATLLILPGDNCIRPDVMDRFLEEHRRSGNTITILPIRAPQRPALGRIVRHPRTGQVNGIAEAGFLEDLIKEGRPYVLPDGTEMDPREILETPERNRSVYLISPAEAFLRLAGPITPTETSRHPAGEYFLTDIIAAAVRAGEQVGTIEPVSEREILDINTVEQYDFLRLVLTEDADKWRAWSRGFARRGREKGTVAYADARGHEYVSRAFAEGRAFALCGHAKQSIPQMVADYERKSGKTLKAEERQTLISRLGRVKRFIDKLIDTEADNVMIDGKVMIGKRPRERLSEETRIVVILDEEGKPFLYDEGIAGTEAHKYLTAFGGRFRYEGSEEFEKPRSVYLSLAQIEGFVDLGLEGEEALGIKLAHEDGDLQRGYHLDEDDPRRTSRVDTAIQKLNRRYGLMQLQEPFEEARNYLGDGTALRPGQYREYLGRTHRFLNTVVELLVPDAETRNGFERRIDDVFRRGFNRQGHGKLRNILIELSRGRAEDRDALESIAMAGELIDIALVLNLGKNITSEETLWQQLDKFFRSNIDYSVECVRTLLQTSPDFQVGYDDMRLGKERNQEADSLFARRQAWLNGYVRNLVLRHAGVSSEYLNRVCTIGNTHLSADARFGLEYHRFFEMARLRTHDYPLPERVEENFDPRSREFANRSNIGILYRWGHTQMVFAERAASARRMHRNTNIMLIPDNHGNVEVVKDPYSGEYVVQAKAGLFYDSKGRLTLARFSQPIRLDAAVVPGKNSLLPEVQRSGIPMPWSTQMYDVSYDKTLYDQMFPTDPGEETYYYPRQLSFDKISGEILERSEAEQQRHKEAETARMAQQIRDFIAAEAGLSEIKLGVKPATGSGGRNIFTHEVRVDEPDAAAVAIAEDAYNGRRGDKIVVQQFARPPPLDRVGRVGFLRNAKETLRRQRQAEGRPFNENAELHFSLRTIATRMDEGTVVNIKVILVSDSDVVSMTQGAVMFLLDESVFDKRKTPSDLIERMEEASRSVLDRVNQYCQGHYQSENEPLDGDSYLNVDNLLLDWVLDGDRMELANVEFNIGLGTFWFHNHLLRQAGQEEGIGVDPFLKRLEARADRYRAALDQRAQGRYAYDANEVSAIVGKYGVANLATQEAQEELYGVISTIDMEQEDENVRQRVEEAGQEGRQVAAFIGGLGFAGVGLSSLFADAKELTDLTQIREAASSLPELKGISGQIDRQLDKVRRLLAQERVKRAKLLAELSVLENLTQEAYQTTYARLKKAVQEEGVEAQRIRADLERSSQAATALLLMTSNVRQVVEEAPSRNLYTAFPIQRISRTSGPKIATVNEGIFPFSGENDGLDRVMESGHNSDTLWATPSREAVAYADITISTLRLDIVRLPAEIEAVKSATDGIVEVLESTEIRGQRRAQILRDKIDTLTAQVQEGRDDIPGMAIAADDRRALLDQLGKLRGAVGRRGAVGPERLANARNEAANLQWSVQKITEEAEGIFGPTFPEIEEEIRQMAPYFARNIEARAREGREKPAFFILTTQAPGVCMNILRMMLEEELANLGYDYKAGRDFYFGFKPSRVTPGREWQRSINRMPHIVGGMSLEDSTVCKRHLEGIVMADVHTYGSPEAAELHKTFENTWRDLVISASNVLALYADFLGTADAWETRDQIDERPTHHPLWPGFVAGYCLYKDPWFLEWASRYLERLKRQQQDEFTARDTMTLEAIVEFTQLFREERDVNRFMAYYASGLVMHGLEKAGIPKDDARVLLSGIRYLDIPIPDTRNSGTEHIIAGLIGWRKGLAELPKWAQDAYEKAFARTGHLSADNITLFDPFVAVWGELEGHAEEGGDWAQLAAKYQERRLFVPSEAEEVMAPKARRKAWDAVKGQDALVFALKGYVEHQELVSDMPRLYRTMRGKLIVDLRNVMGREQVQEWLALGGTYVGMGKGEFVVDRQLQGEMEFRRDGAENLLAALEAGEVQTAQETLGQLSEGTDFENIPLAELDFDTWLSLGGRYYALRRNRARLRERFDQAKAALSPTATGAQQAPPAVPVTAGPVIAGTPATIQPGSREMVELASAALLLHGADRFTRRRYVEMVDSLSPEDAARRAEGHVMSTSTGFRDLNKFAQKLDETEGTANLYSFTLGAAGGGNIRIDGSATVAETATLRTEGSGTIIVQAGAEIQAGAQIIAGDGDLIVIGKGTTILAGRDTIIRGTVAIGENCEISGRVTNAIIGGGAKLHDKPVVTMAALGRDCHMNSGSIKGYRVEGRGNEFVYEDGKPVNIVVVGNGARIEGETIRTVAEKHSWRLVEARDDSLTSVELGTHPLRNIEVVVNATVIEGRDPETGKVTVIERGTIINAEIGGGTHVEPEAFVTDATVGRRCRITAHARLELTALKGDNRFGSEASKTSLGRGTTSAHKSTYDSVVSHESIPVFNAEGGVDVLDLGANCSIIPAGLVFANRLGTRGTAGEALKGTAHLLGPSTIASGTIIVNLAGKPDIPLEKINDEDDMTVISPFCFLRGNVRGQVLPFTKAGEEERKMPGGKVDRTPNPSPRYHEIGGVLDNYTSMILDQLALLKRHANPEVFDRVVERVLMDGIMRVKRELDNPRSRYDKYKLIRGMEIYEVHLYSGAWRMEGGNFAWGGRIEEGQDFTALEGEIKTRVAAYRRSKLRERCRPIGEWIVLYEDTGDEALNATLRSIYGDRPQLIERRRQSTLHALRQAAQSLGPNREVFIVRSPARINICGMHNMDAEDGDMNYLSDDRENVMIVARRDDDTINLHNITPGFAGQRVSFNISDEIAIAPAAWDRGWNEYITHPAVMERVDKSQRNPKEEWVNVPRGAVLNMIHDLSKVELSYASMDIRGYDALVYSDIPVGGGVSSSSAFAVSSVLGFLSANGLQTYPEIIAMLPYEIYTGELGGNGDHAAVMLARTNQILHLSQMNSTGKAEADYLDLPDDIEIAIVPSFVTSKKTGAQKVENNKVKFSFKLAVPLIRDILRNIQSSYPDVLTDEFIENFRYIGQLRPQVLAGESGDEIRGEKIIYEVLKRLPEGETIEDLLNRYPQQFELRNLARKFGLSEEELQKFEAAQRQAEVLGEQESYDRTMDLKGAVMFFLATTDRAHRFSQYLREAQAAQAAGQDAVREERLKKAGELMNISHDGDRRFRYDPATDDVTVYAGTPVTNESLDALIAQLDSGQTDQVEGARLHRQPGYYRASVVELDAITDIANSLDFVYGATVTGAGFGGNVVVLYEEREGALETLRQALDNSQILRETRQQFAHETGVGEGDLVLAKANVPISGASVVRIEPQAPQATAASAGPAGPAGTTAPTGPSITDGGVPIEDMLGRNAIGAVVNQALIRAATSPHEYIADMGELGNIIATSQDDTLRQRAELARALILAQHPNIATLLGKEDNASITDLEKLITGAKIGKVATGKIGLIVSARFIMQNPGVREVLQRLADAETDFVIVVDAATDEEQRAVERLNLPGRVVIAKQGLDTMLAQKIENLVGLLGRKGVTVKQHIGLIGTPVPGAEMAQAVASLEANTAEIRIRVPQAATKGQLISANRVFHDVIEAIADSRRPRVSSVLPAIEMPSVDLQRIYKQYREAMETLGRMA